MVLGYVLLLFPLLLTHTAVKTSSQFLYIIKECLYFILYRIRHLKLFQENMKVMTFYKDTYKAEEDRK